MGTAGFWMPAAALAYLPSASLICSRRPSVWTLTPACLRRAVAPGPYRLVTFGQSFHWTDKQQVAETVYDMLEPGGALALIVHTVRGRPRPPDPGVPPIPHDEIKALVEKYLGSVRRAGQGTAPERTHRFEDVLARTRFGVPQQFFVPGTPDLLRDSESVLSGYFSLSSSAPHLFGDRLDDFAGEVRALLANRSAEGIFWDWPGDTEVVMAANPAEQVAVASPCAATAMLAPAPVARSGGASREGGCARADPGR